MCIRHIRRMCMCTHVCVCVLYLVYTMYTVSPLHQREINLTFPTFTHPLSTKKQPPLFPLRGPCLTFPPPPALFSTDLP